MDTTLYSMCLEPAEHMECWKGSFGLHYEGTRIGNFNFVPENNDKLPVYFPS